MPTKVHYNPTSLETILYLKDVEISNGVKLTMDTSKEHAIKASLPNDKTLVVKECNDGLNNLNINDIKKYVMAYSCLQIINKNTTHFTNRLIVGA